MGNLRRLSQGKGAWIMYTNRRGSLTDPPFVNYDGLVVLGIFDPKVRDSPSNLPASDRQSRFLAARKKIQFPLAVPKSLSSLVWFSSVTHLATLGTLCDYFSRTILYGTGTLQK